MSIDDNELDEYADLLDGFHLDDEDDFSALEDGQWNDEAFYGSEEAKIEREISELEVRCGFRV